MGTIFPKAQNRIQDPAKLRRLVVNLINDETWTSVVTDVKGDAYEAILQDGAADTKSGAGLYFTPRRLCAMNLLLHGIGTANGKSLVTVAELEAALTQFAELAASLPVEEAD